MRVAVALRVVPSPSPVEDTVSVLTAALSCGTAGDQRPRPWYPLIPLDKHSRDC